MALIDYLSSTARSVIYTMTCAGKKSPLQRLPSELYVMPSADQRILAARLILEEALETVRDMGVDVSLDGAYFTDVSAFDFDDRPEQFDMMGAIDGCIDTRYVATWALCAMGVPDIPHEREVNRANNHKFPDGQAIVNEHGKYLKPAGWVGPDHERVKELLFIDHMTATTWNKANLNLNYLGERIACLGDKHERGEA